MRPEQRVRWQPDWSRLRDKLLVAVLALVLAFAAVQVMERLARVLALVVVATVVAIALEPVIRSLEAHVPRPVAAIGTYAVALAGLAGLILLILESLVTQSLQLISRLPAYSGRVQGELNHWGLGALTSGVSGSAQDAARTLLLQSVNLLGAIAGGFVDFSVVLIIAFWLMVDGARFGRWLLHLLPTRHRPKAMFIQTTVIQLVGAYVRGQLTLAAIIGASSGLICWALGVPYPLVIGVLAFLFELVPMIGPILASIPAILIAAFQPFPLVLVVAACFLVMQMAENNLLAPRIAGHAVGLHPATALLALLAGAELGGILGALLAVPAAGIAAVLVTAVWKGWRGEAVVIRRGGMTFRLPRLHRRRRVSPG